MNEKKEQKTAAQILLKDHELLLKRPDDMSFFDFRLIQYSQNLLLKKMFRRCLNKKLINIIPGHEMYRRKRIRKIAEEQPKVEDQVYNES